MIRPEANIPAGPKALRALLAIAVAALIIVVSPARAADPTAAATASAQNPDARALMLDMAHFMAHAPGLRVAMRSSYDAIQADGERIEFGERREILMQRPDKLRVEVERSDGERGGFVFDGSWITAFNASDNVYARVKKPGSLDQALVYMVRDLQAKIPLARMLTTGFAEYVDKRVKSAKFVEECTLFDVPTNHVTAQSDEVDLQLWIAKGPEPLPRRVVITYKNARGQPQFRADLYDWSVAPKADVAAFTFVPPAGAEQITYLAPRRLSDGPTAPTGEQP